MARGSNKTAAGGTVRAGTCLSGASRRGRHGRTVTRWRTARGRRGRPRQPRWDHRRGPPAWRPRRPRPPGLRASAPPGWRRRRARSNSGCVRRRRWVRVVWGGFGTVLRNGCVGVDVACGGGPKWGQSRPRGQTKPGVASRPAVRDGGDGSDRPRRSTTRREARPGLPSTDGGGKPVHGSSLPTGGNDKKVSGIAGARPT